MAELAAQPARDRFFVVPKLTNDITIHFMIPTTK
jgi:hypothetical protein